jgi:hypothetical protein
MPGRAIPSPRATATVCAARPARRPGSAGNVDSETAPRFPSTQSSESHAKHNTSAVARQSANSSGVAAFAIAIQLSRGCASPTGPSGQNPPERHKPRAKFPLTYRNPSANISFVKTCALTAGAFSRFFFCAARLPLFNPLVRQIAPSAQFPCNFGRR